MFNFIQSYHILNAHKFFWGNRYMSDKDNTLLKWWPVLVTVLSGAVTAGMIQSQVSSLSSETQSIKTYNDANYRISKTLEQRVGIIEVKQEYQSQQNTQILSQLKEQTQATNDLRVVIESLKSRLPESRK